MDDKTTPQILPAPYLRHLGQCDCDCACALGIPEGTASPLLPHDLWVKESRLCSFSLNSLWSAVVNPVGPAGLVVVNRPAEQMLASFAEPRPLTLDSSSIEQTAALQLARVGLLQPCRTETPAAVTAPALAIWVHLNDACNLACPYCYVPKRDRRMSTEAGDRAISRILGLASRHGYSSVYLKYSGGEPTLNFPVLQSTYDDAVRQGQKIGITVRAGILTNGVHVSSAMLDVISARGIQMMVSLDGGAAAHDSVRSRGDGVGTYSAVVSTIRQALDRAIHPHISITLTAANLAGAVEAVAFALANELPFNLNFYRECGAPAAEITSCSPLAADRVQLTETLWQIMALLESYPAYPLSFAGILDRLRLDVPHSRPCSAGQHYLTIDPDGWVAPCQMLLDTPWSNLDSDDPLEDLRTWFHEYYQPVEDLAGCQRCIWRTTCAGGCPMLRGTQLHQEYCSVYRTFCPELVRIEGKRLLATSFGAGLAVVE